MVIHSYGYAIVHHELQREITHSDRKNQYTSHKFKDFSKKNGRIGSLTGYIAKYLGDAQQP